MVDDALVAGCVTNVAVLAKTALILCHLSGQRIGRGLVCVGKVKVGDGAVLAARVVECLRGSAGAVHVLRYHGTRGSRFSLGRARDDVFPIGRGRNSKSNLVRSWTQDGHVSFVLDANASLCADEVDPFLGGLVGRGAEVVVAGRGEDAKDVVHLLLRVSLAGDGSDLGKVDLMAQLGLVLVLVDGEAIWAQDKVDGLP